MKNDHEGELLLVKLQAKTCKRKPATLLKVTLLDGCFSRLLNRTNNTKSCKASHLRMVLSTEDLHPTEQVQSGI